MNCPHCAYPMERLDAFCPRCGKAPGVGAGDQPAYQAHLLRQVMDRTRVDEARARRALERCGWAVEAAVASLRSGPSPWTVLLVVALLVLVLAVGVFAALRHVTAGLNANQFIPKTQPQGWKRVGRWTAGGSSLMGMMTTKKLGTFSVTAQGSAGGSWKLVCGTSPGPQGEARVLTPMPTFFGICEAGKAIPEIEEAGWFTDVQPGGQKEQIFERKPGTFDLLVRAGTACEAEVWERTQ